MPGEALTLLGGLLKPLLIWRGSRVRRQRRRSVADGARGVYDNAWHGFAAKCVHQLAEILAVLREFAPLERESAGVRRTTGWAEVEWLLSPNALLDGAVTADALATVPGQVLEAVRTEFEHEA